ncbi:MAG TPA: acyl carrier protein [Steroidobacter sp.]|jgi:acyl carrier protein|nr:acyl carrier protein [Steroidobacteraceae bacterium]HLS81592.1 acyl carrier protein [Steroidobacter sp.]
MDARLRLLVAELLDLSPDEVLPDLRRADTPTWDSLNHLRLITAVENEFGVSFTMEQIAELATPQELQRAIDACAGASAAPAGA